MTWATFLNIVEIRTKLVSVSTFLLACLSVLWTEGSLPWHTTLLLFIAVLSVDMGTTAFNTYFDFARGVDNRRTNRESDKVLVHNKVAPGYALLTALGLFAFAAVLGLFLVLWTGWPLLVLGIASFVVAFLYSGGPRPISSTPWGELFAGLFLGTVLWLVVGFVLTGPSRWTIDLWVHFAILSLPSFLFIASILTVNNCCDREGDRAAGRHTLAILWGPRTNLLIVILPLLAYGTLAILAWAQWIPPSFWLVAIAGPAVTIPLWRKMFLRGFQHETKGPSMGAVTQTFAIYTIVSLVGWVTGLALR